MSFRLDYIKKFINYKEEVMEHRIKRLEKIVKLLVIGLGSTTVALGVSVFVDYQQTKLISRTVDVTGRIIETMEVMSNTDKNIVSIIKKGKK